ncbi:hypothetical protein GCM10023238_10490 [Streptomyces heliomycini]
MAVMCHVLGMPDEYGDRIVEAARDMIRGTETAIASNAYVMEALGRLTARSRAEPLDDFAGHLVGTGGTDRRGGRPAPEGGAHRRLRGHRQPPRQRAAPGADRPRFRSQLNGGQMTVPQAVEQLLWDEPPFSTIFAYFAKQDTELGGRRIRKGDGLLFAPAPANVDPRVRPDRPPTCRATARPRFGGGTHECPGQDIGRVVAEVGVDALLMRLPDVELGVGEEELSFTESIASRHLVNCPFTSRPAAAGRAAAAQPRERRAPAARLADRRDRGGGLRALRALRAGRAGRRAARAAAVPPQPQPQPQPQPTPAPRGAWQRFLYWWRGY